MIQQITIIGTGSIGGSLALGLKKYGFMGRIIGCDRQPVLDAAIARGGLSDEHIDNLWDCLFLDTDQIAELYCPPAVRFPNVHLRRLDWLSPLGNDALAAS